jgi:hypothetical protein
MPNSAASLLPSEPAAHEVEDICRRGPKVQDFQDIASQLANWEIENYPREFDSNSPFIMAAKLSVQPSRSKIEPRKVLSVPPFVVYSILILTLSPAYNPTVGFSCVRWHSWWCRSSSDGERSALFILLDHSLTLLVSI